MRISIETYNRIKSAIHPNIRKIIKNFKEENYYVFPKFHGCNKINRNGTRKKVNYRQGHFCILGTDSLYWKKLKYINIKKLPYKLYFTRYGGANHDKNSLITIKNPNQWFDWDKKNILS